MSTPILTRQAVHTALVELLTTGQHHHAATPATLTAVGEARQSLATLTHDPAAPGTREAHRLAALTRALGDLGAALFATPTGRRPDPARLHPALGELAAVALGWLDILPEPDPDPWGQDEKEPEL